MRVIINGKTYRLKENIKMRLQGITLLILGVLCHETNADGAAIFIWFLGVVMLASNAKTISKIIYQMALKIVRSERRKYYE